MRPQARHAPKPFDRFIWRGKYDAAAALAGLLTPMRTWPEDLIAELGDWYTAQRERPTGTVIVKPVARVVGHFEVVDHYNRPLPRPLDDLEFLRKRQVMSPMSVEVEQHVSVRHVFSVRKLFEVLPRVSTCDLDALVSPKTSTDVVVALRIEFDRVDIRPVSSKDCGRCASMRTGLHDRSGLDGTDDFRRESPPFLRPLKRPAPGVG